MILCCQYNIRPQRIKEFEIDPSLILGRDDQKSFDGLWLVRCHWSSAWLSDSINLDWKFISGQRASSGQANLSKISGIGNLSKLNINNLNWSLSV